MTVFCYHLERQHVLVQRVVQSVLVLSIHQPAYRSNQQLRRNRNECQAIVLGEHYLPCLCKALCQKLAVLCQHYLQPAVYYHHHQGICHQGQQAEITRSIRPQQECHQKRNRQRHQLCRQLAHVDCLVRQYIFFLHQVGLIWMLPLHRWLGLLTYALWACMKVQLMQSLRFSPATSSLPASCNPAISLLQSLLALV